MDKNMKMIHEKTDNFYNQKLHLTNVRKWRFEFFAELCEGKKVLHIGCADSMVYDPQTNLHIYLSKIDTRAEEAKKEATEQASEELAEEPKKTEVHGMDIDVATLKLLEEACQGTYFSSYDQIKQEYDLVLIPEVMEHVPNVKAFLEDIFSVNSNEYMFTVPSIFASQIFCDDTYSLEMVHPDHKYWFSPYTLYNLMTPYMNAYNAQMYYLENKSQVGIRLWKKTEEELQEWAIIKAEIEAKKAETKVE